MRHLMIVGALAAGSLLWSVQAEAREYPWCARYDWTTSNCGFVSFQQCLATISGIGGRCEQNPRYVPQQQSRQKKKPRRR
jgi:hypothetical protein